MADNRTRRKKAKFKTRTKLVIPKMSAADKERFRRRLRIARQVFFLLLLTGVAGIFLYNNRDYILSAAEEFSFAAILPEKDEDAARAKFAKRAAADSIKTAKKVAADSIKTAKKLGMERMMAEKLALDAEAKFARKAAADSIKAAKKLADDSIKAAKNVAADSIRTAKKINAEKAKAEKHAKRARDIKTADEILGEREFGGAEIAAVKRDTIPKQLDIDTVKKDIPPKREPAPVVAKKPEPVIAKKPEPVIAKKTEPVILKKSVPVTVKTPAPVPAPPPPKFSPASDVSSVESFTLADVKCRLADRADLGISVTAELFFVGGALRREIIFKRGLLETLTASVVRRHESGSVRPAALSADLLTAYNGALEAGRLNRVDVKDFRVEGAAP